MDVMGSSRGILAAHQPLIVPMLLRLSNFRLNAYVVLVVSKQKGITLVFKTDPLQNVDVNSTFDSITVIQKFIQKELEGQLREMFREDLPAIIHRLSQRWTAGKTKVEAPYLHKNPTTLPRDKVYTPSTDAVSRPPSVHPPASAAGTPVSPVVGSAGYAFPSVGLRPAIVPRPLSLSLSHLSHVPHLRVPAPKSALSRVSEPLPELKTQSPGIERTSSFPDLENYDPTYGLRPEGLPSKSSYSGLGRLFSPAKGLAELGEEEQSAAGDRNGEEGTEYDVVEWEDTAPDYSTHPPSVAEQEESEVEYETLPAVGGGTITRPRVVHSQSMGVASDTVSRTSRPASTARSALPTPSTSRPHSHTPRNGSHTHLHRSTLERLEDDSSPPDPVTTWREQQLRQQQQQQQGLHNPYFPEMGVAGPSKLGPGRPASSYQASVGDHHHHHHHPSRVARHLSPTMDETQRHSRRQSGASDVRLSSSSSYTRLSHSSGRPPTVSTPPSSDRPGPDDEAGSPIMKDRERQRRRSLSPSVIQPFDGFHFGSPPRHTGPPSETNPKIVLRPHANMTVSHLSALTSSYHTLSPYTHSVEHFTVRSIPPKPQTPTVPVASHGLDKGKPVRARRKRMIRLGAKKEEEPPAEESRRPSPHIAPSEFSDEVDHYFKPGDSPPVGMRQRLPYEQVT